MGEGVRKSWTRTQARVGAKRRRQCAGDDVNMTEEIPTGGKVSFGFNSWVLFEELKNRKYLLGWTDQS